MIIYAAGGETPAPWISEASLAVDWEALNPSADEAGASSRRRTSAPNRSTRDELPQEGMQRQKSITLLPFYWGFDLGMNISEDEMYKMLTVIDKHADELAKLDPSYKQIAGGKMAAFQKEALEPTCGSRPDPSRPGQVSQGEEACGTPSLGLPRRQGDDVRPDPVSTETTRRA